MKKLQGLLILVVELIVIYSLLTLIFKSVFNWIVPLYFPGIHLLTYPEAFGAIVLLSMFKLKYGK